MLLVKSKVRARDEILRRKTFTLIRTMRRKPHTKTHNVRFSNTKMYFFAYVCEQRVICHVFNVKNCRSRCIQSHVRSVAKTYE